MADGVLLFSRYAYPPNELGYCGPERPQQLLEQVSAGASDEGLRQLARGFEGAWPYLELIAASAGMPTPSTSAWSRRTGWAIVCWTAWARD